MRSEKIPDKYYFSLRQKCCGSSEPDLELRVKYQGANNVEIEVLNLRYQIEMEKYKKRLLVLLSLISMYLACDILMKWNEQNHYMLYIPGFFFLILMQTLWAIVHLVRSEKLTYVWKKALQLKTIRTFARQSIVFIPDTCIHDLVINEVIENLGVKYILIVRTKGDLFKVQPVIPLLKNIEPSIECLIYIYRLLNKIMPSNELGIGDVIS